MPDDHEDAAPAKARSRIWSRELAGGTKRARRFCSLRNSVHPIVCFRRAHRACESRTCRLNVRTACSCWASQAMLVRSSCSRSANCRAGCPMPVALRPTARGGYPMTAALRPTARGGCPMPAALRPTARGGCPMPAALRPTARGGCPMPAALRPTARGGFNDAALRPTACYGLSPDHTPPSS